jgi:hypothetical protein
MDRMAIHTEALAHSLSGSAFWSGGFWPWLLVLVSGFER